MNLTTKQYLEEKSYRSYAFVVKGKTSGMYIDINGLFERDIEQAQAFSSYEEAEKYIKNSAYPSLLKPVKYVPSAVEIDEENEDADKELWTLHENKNADEYRDLAVAMEVVV